MKKIYTGRPLLLIILLAFTAINFIITFILIGFHFQRKEKVAYVDTIKIFSQYKGMEVLREDLNSKNQSYSSNLNTLKDEIDQAVGEYEKNKSKYSYRDAKKMEELIDSKQKQFFEYQQVVKDQYQKQERENSTQLANRVTAYIKRYAEKEGYAVILGSNQSGNVLYGNPSLDITEEVLKGLNNEFQALKK